MDQLELEVFGLKKALSMLKREVEEGEVVKRNLESKLVTTARGEEASIKSPPFIVLTLPRRLC